MIVASALRRVKRLMPLALAVCGALLQPNAAPGKRLPPPEPIDEWGLTKDKEEEKEALKVLTFTLGPEEEAVCRDRFQEGNLGLGTAADVYQEVGDGLQVNLLTGNLVWRQTFLPHGMPHGRLALSLSYNSLADAGPWDRQGGLPARWTQSYGAVVQPGPWGMMQVVEEDGYVHRFFRMVEGEAQPREDVIERILDARRGGGVPPGDAIPIGPVFRRRMELDPDFLEAMRGRFLGEGVGLAGDYVSEARGHQLLWVAEDGSARRRRPDGTIDHFGPGGVLIAIEPASGPALEVAYTRGLLSTVEVDRGPRLQYALNGDGSLASVRGEEGRLVHVEYQHGQLVGIDAPQGRWTLGYDEASGALISVAGPLGRARIRYDADGERVASVEGSTATVTFDYGVGEVTLSGQAHGPAGTVSATLDLGTQLREISHPRGSSSVQFDAGLNRPLRVGDVAFSYDDGGHIVGVSTPRGTLRIETDGDQRPTRIVGPTGSAITLTHGLDGRLEGAADQTGVSMRYHHDRRGQLDRVEQGATGEYVTLGRNGWGEVERIARSGVGSYYLRRDTAGRPVSFRSPGGAEMHLRWDAGDQLIGAQAAGGVTAEVIRGLDGELRIADSRQRMLVFTRGADGRLASAERTGVPHRLLLGGGGEGLPVSLASDTGWRVDVTHVQGRTRSLTGGPTGTLEYRYEGHRLAELAVGLVRWSFLRDGDGRVTEIQNTGGRSLSLGYRSGELVRLSHGTRPGYTVVRDAAGRPQQVDGATGSALTLTRDTTGRVTDVLDGDDTIVQLVRDLNGLPVAVARDDAEPWNCTFNVGGVPHQVSHEERGLWSLELDPSGRLVGGTGADGRSFRARWTSDAGLVSLQGMGADLQLGYGENQEVVSISRAAGRPATYRWHARGVDTQRGDSAARTLAFDSWGRPSRSARPKGEQVFEELTWGVDGLPVSWVRGPQEITFGGDSMGRLLGFTTAAGRSLELTWGGDGLLTGWRFGDRQQNLGRDSLGRAPAAVTHWPVTEPPLGVTPTAPPGVLSRALLGGAMPPPWGTPTTLLPGIDAPLPRWAVDLLWARSNASWTAALPPPPGSDLAMPDAPGMEPLSVLGLLTLLGFATTDDTEYRTLACLPPPPLTVPCPGAAELRVLQDLWLGPAGPLGTVSVEPGARGLSLHPDGVPLGHRLPWAAVADPFALEHPASRVLGLPTATAAPAAGARTPARWADRDPLADSLGAALDAGRWLSATPTSGLGNRFGLQLEMAGAVQLWTASRMQAVVDGRGRLRGLDLGATAVDVWKRLAVQRVLAPPIDGRAGGPLVPMTWLPAPGAQPEQALGLCPSGAHLWPTWTGEIQQTP